MGPSLCVRKDRSEKKYGGSEMVCIQQYVLTNRREPVVIPKHAQATVYLIVSETGCQWKFFTCWEIAIVVVVVVVIIVVTVVVVVSILSCFVMSCCAVHCPFFVTERNIALTNW